MATTNINIRMDTELKKQFAEFCEDVGMSMSTAFTLFAKRTVRDNCIPFEIGDRKPNVDTLEALRETEEILKHPDQYKSYGNVDEMFRDILQ